MSLKYKIVHIITAYCRIRGTHGSYIGMLHKMRLPYITRHNLHLLHTQLCIIYL